MIKKGDRVQIKPEWQDGGHDGEIPRYAVCNEYNGKIRIVADLGLFINPVELLTVDKIYKIEK